MSISSGAQELWSNEDLTAAGGPYYGFVLTKRADRLLWQWTLRVAAAADPAAAFTFYSTTLDDVIKLKNPLDETNFNWTDETSFGAVFTKVPGTVADDSGRLALGGNASIAYMVKLDVLSDMTGFTLRVNQVG